MTATLLTNEQKTDLALSALEKLADQWAIEINLAHFVTVIHQDPSKADALIRQFFIEGAYRGFLHGQEIERHRSSPSSAFDWRTGDQASHRARNLAEWLAGMDWPNDQDGMAASAARIDSDFKAIQSETRMERAVFVRQWLEEHGNVVWKVQDLIDAMMPLPETERRRTIVATKRLRDAALEVVAAWDARPGPKQRWAPMERLHEALLKFPPGVAIAPAMLAASPPAPSVGDDMDRMVQIEKLIAELQSTRDRFGNTCVYIRRGGLSWGAVALNRRDDDKKFGVFDLQAQHDRDMMQRVGQVERLLADKTELSETVAAQAKTIEGLEREAAEDAKERGTKCGCEFDGSTSGPHVECEYHGYLKVTAEATVTGLRAEVESRTAYGEIQAAEVERLTGELVGERGGAQVWENAALSWQQKYEAAESSLETARGALEQGAKWFREYEAQHNAKGTTDGNAKAWVNSVRATALEQALAALPSPPITKIEG